MAKQTADQAAAIAEFVEWANQRSRSEEDFEAQMARHRLEERVKWESRINRTGEAVLKRLNELNVKRSHLATATGIARSTLYRILNGIESEMLPEEMFTEPTTPKHEVITVEPIEDSDLYKVTVRGWGGTLNATDVIVAASGGARRRQENEEDADVFRVEFNTNPAFREAVKEAIDASDGS